MIQMIVYTKSNNYVFEVTAVTQRFINNQLNDADKKISFTHAGGHTILMREHIESITFSGGE